MISLQPQSQFTIVRQLEDISDPATYYVQAVVRNSVTDAILKTIPLTDKGSKRYKATYEVPADVSGLGFYIDITTSVYTDSGYTTLSDYNVENEQYLVYDRVVRNSGGGGGVDVDYKKIQKMIDQIVKEIPDAPKLDLTPVLKGLQSLQDAVSAIEIPEAEKVSFEPVLVAIHAAQRKIEDAIDAKEVTPETDLSPVLAALNEKEPDLTAVLTHIDAVREAITAFIEADKAEKANSEQSAAGKLQQLADKIMPILSGNQPNVAPAENPITSRAKKLL